MVVSGPETLLRGCDEGLVLISALVGGDQTVA